MNDKTYRVLELDKILAQLAAQTAFSASADLALTLTPTGDVEEARVWSAETAEARAMFANGMNVSVGGARDVREAAVAATRGIVPEAQTFLDVRGTLRRATTLRRTVGRMKGQYPLLSDLVNTLEEVPALQDEIGRILDDAGIVRDSASPRLAIVRRDLKIAFDRLQTRLQRMVSASANQPLLQESLYTMRNGRYVIPLKAEHRGKIPGIIHDSSSSGATLFIEPLETVELNNQWRELQLDEEKEIRRILAALTDDLAAEHERVVHTVNVLAYFDLVLAKARYADLLKAAAPQLVQFAPHPLATGDAHPGSTIALTAARHPLLKGDVVPIDVEFDANTFVLVVTGPNTGGKTVSLKTVGLFVLMAQCGLHVPAERARLSVFEGVYADIGDEQSIEQSLSTFSSHMKNTIAILDEADERSLVLLDELGAGTDPGEGSALARAILTHLRGRRITTMVTTHHPELKVYSVETPGVRNASVEFNLETLAPTYRLIVGLPGRSNALAIATRLGLPEPIIADARGMVATEDLLADDLLDEIHRTREDMRRQQAVITETRERIEQERAELRQSLSAVEDEKRNIIAAGRRNMQTEMEDFRKEMRRLRAELRDAGLPLETLKKAQAQADALESAVNRPVEPSRPAQAETDWTPRLGDGVWLETLKAEGTVVELDKNDAVVQVGTLRVRAKLHDLARPQPQAAKKSARSKKAPVVYEAVGDISTPKVQSPGMELDLRGTRVDEAIRRLDHYVDQAYLSGLPFGRIIHGKGTGALRKAIQERLRDNTLIMRSVTAPPNEGGEGVTVIYLASKV
jgi:DNA mismatch repair protein MutS2